MWQVFDAVPKDPSSVYPSPNLKESIQCHYMTSFERRGKQFLSFPRKFNEIVYVFLWPCPVHHKHKQLYVLSPVDNSLICFLSVLIFTSEIFQTDLWSSLVRPSAMTNDRSFSKKLWCRAVGNTTAFVWCGQVKRVVTDALSHKGESWLQPFMIQISWSLLHWFVLLEKWVSRYAGNVRAQPNKRYLCQGYFLLGIQINKIILDEAVFR